MRPALFAVLLLAAPAAAAPPFVSSAIATLDNPWGMAFLPDGRALITEKPGRVRILADGKLSAPLTGVPKVAYGGQGGLLDVEVGPGFARDRHVYLSYAEGGPDGTKGLAVARGTLTATGLDGVRVIWRQSPKVSGSGHFGGRMAITAKGELFVSAGERQKMAPAQAPAQTLGKIVRLTLDGAPFPGNPLAAQPGHRPETWTLGHRNPLGLALDPATGALWEHEMGPQGGDEVNLIVAARNYGWPEVSNGSHYDGRDIPDHSTGPRFEAPKTSWNPSISPSGMIVYSGDLFPAWRGHILMGGLSSEALFDVAIRGSAVAAPVQHAMGARIREVAQGPDGAVWLLTDGDDGKLLKLTPR